MNVILLVLMAVMSDRSRGDCCNLPFVVITEDFECVWVFWTIPTRDGTSGTYDAGTQQRYLSRMYELLNRFEIQ